MRLHWGNQGLHVLNRDETVQIVENALRILETVGVRVENEKILLHLREVGGIADLQNQIIRFPRHVTEQYLERIEKVGLEDRPVTCYAAAEIYQGYYLDPLDGTYKEWNERRFLDYVKLAKNLDGIDAVSMLGCPLAEVPLQKQPLYEKLYVWKYGISGGDAIWDTALCPKIYRMYECYADSLGKPIEEVFRGTVYLISPLKFGSVESSQFLYFQERGLKVQVGFNGALGGGLPVTLAGALSVEIAERIFTSLLDYAYFKKASLTLAASISNMDMRHGFQQYGRPEKSIANLAMGEIARYLGVSCTNHCGLSDAKTPGMEAGVQKTMSAAFAGTGSGTFYIAAGLLGTDEIFSPVQMILDNDCINAFRRIACGMEAGEKELAFQAIREEGPGASFPGYDHTFENFREALWMPNTWSSSMFQYWKGTGCKNDVDLATEQYRDIMKNSPDPEIAISERVEKRLLDMIE